MGGFSHVTQQEQLCPLGLGPFSWGFSSWGPFSRDFSFQSPGVTSTELGQSQEGTALSPWSGLPFPSVPFLGVPVPGISVPEVPVSPPQSQE